MNSPTTIGQHWFKAAGADDWQPYYVTTLDGVAMICQRSDHNVTSRCLVSEMPAGQWSKAHNPDEGIDAWAVFVEGMIRCHSIASTKEAVKDQLPFFESMHNKKCTVEAVTIYRKQES